MTIINKNMKSSLVRQYTRLCLYKTLAQLVLNYGSEVWIVRNEDISRIKASEMKFTLTIAKYTFCDY